MSSSPATLQNFRQRLSFATPIMSGPSKPRRPGRDRATHGPSRTWAAGPRLPIGLQIVALQGHGRLEQRHLDRRALSRLLTLHQRGQDAAERVNGRHLIDRRDRTADEPAAFVAGQRHDAGEGLQNHVVARRFAQRPRSAEAGDAAMDEPLVDRLQRGRIDAEPFRHAGAEALDGDVGLARKSRTIRWPSSVFRSTAILRLFRFTLRKTAPRPAPETAASRASRRPARPTPP